MTINLQKARFYAITRPGVKTIHQYINGNFETRYMPTLGGNIVDPRPSEKYGYKTKEEARKGAYEFREIAKKYLKGQP